MYDSAGNYHPETVDNIPTFEYYDCPIEIDGKEFNAHIRVKNTNVGDKYYGHTISEVVDIKIESPTRTSVSENRTAQLEKTGDSTEDLISPMGSLVGPAPTAASGKSSPQTNYIPYLPNAVKPYSSTPHDYAALLRKLAKEREDSETLTPEQETRLDTWNLLFPEMRMTADEFLAR
ncbi:MAG: hypothetical protein IJV43_02950 [Oscillospiraceae bacterium]|nr:hypothetical protein [Oscillospiraceae bacterium]